MHRKSVSALLAGVMIAALGAFGGATPAGAASDVTVVVGPNNVNTAGASWVSYNEGTGTGSTTFVAGPTGKPLGVGSVQLASDVNAREVLQNIDPTYAGISLASITALSYSTRRSSVDAGNNIAPYLQLVMDYDQTDASSAFQGRLTFEPYLTSGGGTIAQNTWNSFNTLSGKWWGSGTPIVGGTPTTQLCTQATPCTWAQVQADYPDAGIGTGLNSGILLRVGGAPGVGLTGQVDALKIGVSGNDKTYDFEPAAAANTVIVGPKQINTAGAKFFTYNDTGNGVGSASLVPGPTGQPIGVGSMQLSDDATSAYVLQLFDPTLANLPLSQLTTLNYSSVRTSANPSNTITPYLQIALDYDGTDADTSFQSRLSFLPSFSGAGPIAQNQWNTWNGLAGKWYGNSANPIVGNVAVPQACPQSAPCTWAQVLAAYPNASIQGGAFNGIFLRDGSQSTSPQVGAVDGLSVGVNGVDTTYDFEPYADLQVSLNSAVKVRHNKPITYTVSVTNAGPAPAQNLTIALKVPAGVTVTNAGGGVPFLGLYGWTQPSLGAGQTVTKTVTGTVTAAKGSQLIALDAAASRTPDPGAGGPLNNFGAFVTTVT
jgi:uncharacterized repeat protein (TIGR01451 family)